MPPRTRDLLDAAAQGGDSQRQGELWTRVREVVANTIRAKAGGALLARYTLEDLVEEALVEVVRCFPGFEYRGPRTFDAWCCTVTETTLLGLARRDGAQKRGPGRLAPASPEQIEQGKGPRQASQTTPSGEASKAETFRRLRDGMALLSNEEQEVVKLIVMERRSPAEVAERLGLSERTVFRRQCKALERLWHHLNEA